MQIVDIILRPPYQLIIIILILIVIIFIIILLIFGLATCYNNNSILRHNSNRPPYEYLCYPILFTIIIPNTLYLIPILSTIIRY